jgi:Rrf2 family protein
MKITKKVRYGLRAMIEISLNKSTKGILQKEISENQEISLKFLDSIIAGLKSAGLIINYSGKRSGYILTKTPSEISVYDIFRAFEPELTVVNCMCPGNICNRVSICPAKDYWSDLNTKIKTQMKSSTLDQIVQRAENLISYELK